MTLETLGVALRQAGIEHPALVLDWDALQHNLAYLKHHLPAGYKPRIADKSLPAMNLLEQALTGLQADAIMSFHLPMTEQVLARFPHVQVLMGKPMPTGAMSRFIASCPQASQVTWLIDGVERLADINDLVSTVSSLKIAFEVDIGLGRGGFRTPDELGQALQFVHPAIQVQGVMGYEAHVNALPTLLGRGQRAQALAQRRLQDFVSVLSTEQRQIINTGGSTTALMLPSPGPGNDLTIGSAIVKPAHFDQACNEGLHPALYVVTPVLKTCPHGLPGHPIVSKWLRRLGLIAPDIAFIYGGNWLAEPLWPLGLGDSPFYGASSNQQGFTFNRRSGEPKHVVFRPTQSEALINQFPCIWVYRAGRIDDHWPTLLT